MALRSAEKGKWSVETGRWKTEKESGQLVSATAGDGPLRGLPRTVRWYSNPLGTTFTVRPMMSDDGGCRAFLLRSIADDHWRAFLVRPMSGDDDSGTTFDWRALRWRPATGHSLPHRCSVRLPASKYVTKRRRDVCPDNRTRLSSTHKTPSCTRKYTSAYAADATNTADSVHIAVCACK